MMLCGLAAASLLLPACATVTRGTKETFNITTTPSDAQVSLSNGQTCVSPCKLKLKRKNGFTATVKKPGYQPEVATVESKFSGGGGAAAAGNILLGGIIGGVVDGSSGALNSFFPSKLDLILKPDMTQPASASQAAAQPAVSPASGGN
jgi:hypothetical protein